MAVVDPEPGNFLSSTSEPLFFSKFSIGNQEFFSISGSEPGIFFKVPGRNLEIFRVPSRNLEKFQNSSEIIFWVALSFVLENKFRKFLSKFTTVF